jgi:hypothetical protein
MVFPPMRKAEETDRSDEFLFKSVTSAFERSRYLVAQFVGGTHNKDLYIYDTSGTRVLHRTARDFTGSLIFFISLAQYSLHMLYCKLINVQTRFRTY